MSKQLAVGDEFVVYLEKRPYDLRTVVRIDRGVAVDDAGIYWTLDGNIHLSGSTAIPSSACPQVDIEEARTRGEVRDMANQLADRAGSMHIMAARQALEDLARLVESTEPQE